MIRDFSKVLYSQLTPGHELDIPDSFPESLRDSILKFHRSEDRNLRIASYKLLETILVEWNGSACTLHNLQRTTSGRPFFPSLPGETRFDFNLSHSGNIAICAALSEGTIGVDVEQCRPFDLEDARAVFSTDTWERIMTSTNPEQEFYRTWTQVESVAKAEGFGISGPIQSIRIDHDRAYFENRTWRLLDVPVGDGYYCHLASSRKLTRDCVSRL